MILSEGDFEMKKRIAVLGTNIFLNTKFHEGQYIAGEAKKMLKYSAAFEIDNFTKKSLTSQSAIKYIKTFSSERKYADCIIELGEADSNNNIDLITFEKNLVTIINYLHEEKIKPILVSLSKNLINKKGYSEYQMIIDNVALKTNVDYIYLGTDNDNASIICKSKSQTKRKIYEFCS